MAAPPPPPPALAVLPPTKRDIVLSFWVYIPPVELYLALADRQAVRVSGWWMEGWPACGPMRGRLFFCFVSVHPPQHTHTHPFTQGRALFLCRSLAYAQRVPR